MAFLARHRGHGCPISRFGGNIRVLIWMKFARISSTLLPGQSKRRMLSLLLRNSDTHMAVRQWHCLNIHSMQASDRDEMLCQRTTSTIMMFPTDGQSGEGWTGRKCYNFKYRESQIPLLNRRYYKHQHVVILQMFSRSETSFPALTTLC